ncbi:MAG: VOC family protein [Pseudomonadota bacterium]
MADIKASLAFWCDLIGFQILYDRPEEHFAYLDLKGAQIMLEQYATDVRQWITGPLEKPLGRGMNMQIEVTDIEAPLDKLRQAQWPLFMEPEEKRYRIGDKHEAQTQFLVQDPDGYLLRLFQAH